MSSAVKTNDKYKISGFTEYDIDIIMNYENPTQLKNITQPNAIGIVFNKDTNQSVSNITPLIMLINSKKTHWEKAVECLVEIGADPDMMIEYYGQ
jgi:hypothetical protein